MKNPRYIKIAVLLLTLSFIEPRLALADEMKDAADAAKDIDKAYQKAQENIPDKDIKEKEDALDKAAQDNDNIQGDPAKDPNKEKAQKKEDDARDKADKADPDKTGAPYRKALKDRREACKKLKKALAELRQLLQKRRKITSDNSDIEQAIRDAEKAEKEQKKTPEPPALSMVAPQGAPTVATFVASGKIKINSTGTGETIGHVADLKIQNLTDQSITCAIPPMILESGSGKNQHYACPTGQTVALNSHQTKTVPMNGVCLNRNKPPVGKGVSGDLVMNEANPTAPQNPNSHIPANQAGALLRICTAKYSAADQLQKSGALKALPYKDKQKQKDIVVQWSTWCDPRISQITGAPPATKDDLKKVVYKQLESKKPMSPETKKKVDQGIDTIFEKVELTTAKAKDLEKPEGETTTEGQPPVSAQQQPEYVGQTRARMPSATPGGAKPEPKGGTTHEEPKDGTTQEKPKPDECKDECKESDTPRNCDAEVKFDLAPADVDPDWLKKVQKAEKVGKEALQKALKKLPGAFKVFGKTYAELLKNMPDYSKIAAGMAKKQGVDVWVMVVCHYEKCEKVECEKKGEKKWAWVKHTDENKPHKLTPPDYAALHEGKKVFDPQLKDEKLYDAIAKAIEDDEDVKKQKEECEAICK